MLEINFTIHPAHKANPCPRAFFDTVDFCCRRRWHIDFGYSFSDAATHMHCMNAQEAQRIPGCGCPGYSGWLIANVFGYTIPYIPYKYDTIYITHPLCANWFLRSHLCNSVDYKTDKLWPKYFDEFVLFFLRILIRKLTICDFFPL